MKRMFTAIIGMACAGFGVGAFAQSAAQVAPALAAGAAAQYGDTLACESVDFKTRRCPVSWRRADLVRQTSKADCIKGRTWGIDRRGLWVSNGCAGVFAQAGRRPGNGNGPGYGPGPGGPGPGAGGDWRPGNDWDRSITLRCASEGFGYRMCQVDTGRGSAVRIHRQISDTRCVEGRNWGWNRAGVWVDGGCDAMFTIERRWR